MSIVRTTGQATQSTPAQKRALRKNHRRRSSLELVYRAGDLDGVYSGPKEQKWTPNPAHLDGVPDMSSLIHLEEPNVLHNLAFRYEKDMIYTSVSNILVAINPYKLLSLYGPKSVERYKHQPRHARVAAGPHVYNVAESAYQNLVHDQQNQSIIACGESGSGKTESAKLLMRYLAESTKHLDSDAPAHRRTKSAISIEQQVLQANPILEAFGNAKTVLNNNSSRFGKFTKVLFTPKDQSKTYGIIGSYIETYLLEKSRVVHQDPGERNYHVFYQLCSNGSDSIKKRLNIPLSRAEEFSYLTGGTTEIDGFVDAELFEEVVNAMNLLNFKSTEMDEIWCTVAGLLQLGNVWFEPEDAKDPEHSKSLIKKGCESFVVKAAELFGVDKQKLTTRLITRTIRLPNQVIATPLSCGEAIKSRNAIAKAVYDGLFQMVVRKINRELYKASDVTADVLWIGILDVFGFESFENNSFEQFCINFCNERLQQYFNEHIIKSEQEEYTREAIFWVPIEIPDNSDVIQLIAGRSKGIVSLLDSACVAPGGNDEMFTRNVFQFHRGNPRIKQARAMRNKSTQRRGSLNLINGFAITHYAGVVVYNAAEFLVKNADSTHQDTIDLFQSSKRKVCREVVSEEKLALNLQQAQKRRMSMTVGSSGGLAVPQQRQRRGSVGARFTGLGTTFIKQLQSLMATLEQTTPFFVRCINPNPIKRPDTFEKEYVRPQLRCGGLIEALRILKCGYPTRISYEDVYKRYGKIVTSKGTVNRRDFTEAVLMAFGLPLGEYQTGLTKVFFRPGKQEFLEKLLATDTNNVSPKVVKAINKHLLMKKFTRMRGALKSFVKLHVRLRSHRAMKRFQHTSGVVVVCVQGVLRALKRVRRGHGALAIQAYLRSAFAQNHLLDKMEGLVIIQRFWRGCRLRQALQERINKRRKERRGSMAVQAMQTAGVVDKLAFEVKTWLQRTLDTTIDGDLFDALMDGILLCKLIKKLEPKLNLSVHTKAKPGTFFARDNVTNFVKACRQLGVPDAERFLVGDLLDRANLKAVVICLLSVSRLGAKNDVTPPPSVVYQQEKKLDLLELVNAIDEKETGVPAASPRGRRQSKMAGVQLVPHGRRSVILAGTSVFAHYLDEPPKPKPPPTLSPAHASPAASSGGMSSFRRRLGRRKSVEERVNPQLVKIQEMLKAEQVADADDPEAALRKLLEERRRLMAEVKTHGDEKQKTKLPKGQGGQDWVDANHMFFFMTALSCKLTCQGPGRDIPTADLYKKAMKKQVPFQYYKDWILKQINKPRKKKKKKKRPSQSTHADAAATAASAHESKQAAGGQTAS